MGDTVTLTLDDVPVGSAAAVAALLACTFPASRTTLRPEVLAGLTVTGEVGTYGAEPLADQLEEHGVSYELRSEGYLGDLTYTYAPSTGREVTGDDDFDTADPDAGSAGD